MRNCSICDSDNIEVLFETDLKYDQIKKMSKVNISSCKNCGFCFNNKLTQNECDEYYENTTNYTHNLYEDTSLKHDRYSHLQLLLEKLKVHKNDPIIDLTSNDGNLIYYLKNLGYNNLTLCDISQENIDKNTTDIKKYKLNIMNQNDYVNINGTYKVIFFNHTLEHIIDFNKFFDNVKNIMNNESFIYIEVPDMNRINSDKNQFLEITYEHVNFFNTDMLNNLSKKYGFFNIENGIVDFKYRLNLEVKGTYGIYKLDNSVNLVKSYDESVKNAMITYINNCLNHTKNIYEQLDKTQKYSIYGIGLYALFFLSMHDIQISNLYDRIKKGFVRNFDIKHVGYYNESETILILNPNYYEMLYNDLKNINPNAKILHLF